MYPDREIDALANVYEELKGFNKVQINRILAWVVDRFGIETKPVLEAKVSEKKVGSSAREEVETARPPVKKRRSRSPAKAKTTGIKQQEEEIDVFKKYETFEDFVKKSKAKTKSDKILLAAAYLQENKNIIGFTSNEVNILINKVGLYVPNISSSMWVICSKDPALIKQKGKALSSKGPKRKYIVTEEGLKQARDFLKK